MVELADAGHLLGPLEGLRLVDDQVAGTSILAAQTFQGIQGDLLEDRRLAPVASPEELAVIGPVRRAAKEFGQAVNRRAVSDGHGQNQAPEVAPGLGGEMIFQTFEKTFAFGRDFVDGKHAAVPLITIARHNRYRQDQPHLFCAFNHQEIQNRSV